MRTLFILSIIFIIGINVDGQLSDEAILGRVDDSRFLQSESYTLVQRVLDEQTVTEDGITSVESSDALIELKVRQFAIDDVRIRIEFVEPDELIGQVFLINNEGVFFWREGLLQPLRVSGQNRAFGDISVSEIAGLAFLGRYRITSHEDSILNESPVVKIELQSELDLLSFPFITAWLEPVTFSPMQIELAALSGTPLRLVTYESYDAFEGDSYSSRITIEDLLFLNLMTTITTEEVRIELHSESLFDLNE
jgi:hypothetical protein